MGGPARVLHALGNMNDSDKDMDDFQDHPHPCRRKKQRRLDVVERDHDGLAHAQQSPTEEPVLDLTVSMSSGTLAAQRARVDTLTTKAVNSKRRADYVLVLQDGEHLLSQCPTASSSVVDDVRGHLFAQEIPQIRSCHIPDIVQLSGVQEDLHGCFRCDETQYTVGMPDRHPG